MDYLPSSFRRPGWQQDQLQIPLREPGGSGCGNKEGRRNGFEDLIGKAALRKSLMQSKEAFEKNILPAAASGRLLYQRKTARSYILSDWLKGQRPPEIRGPLVILLLIFSDVLFEPSVILRAGKGCGAKVRWPFPSSRLPFGEEENCRSLQSVNLFGRGLSYILCLPHRQGPRHRSGLPE